MKKVKEHRWILVIVVLAFLVRFIGVPGYPVGFTQDEAGIGYDAYSILETGKDTWGEFLPLTLRSFGDFKLPLYPYLTIPSIYLFGLNEFSVRLPGVIFGTLAVLTTYLMVGKISGNNKLSLWSSLFLALSPWHVPLSRGAFEANLTTFFIPLGIFAFYKGKTDKKWMIISGLSFGLNLFSYHSARLITPILLLGLIFFDEGKEIVRKPLSSIKEIIKNTIPLIVVFTLFYALVLTSMFMGANSRALDITIFNPTDEWLAMSQKRFHIITQGLSMNVARLFVNKPIFVFEEFIRNYFKYLSPQFFFTEGIANWNYGMVPGNGALYLFEIITVGVGVVGLFRKKDSKYLKLIAFWILVSPLAASLTKGGAAGTRAAVMMPAIQVLSAFGVVCLASFLKGRFKKLLNLLVLILLIVAFTNFVVHFVFYATTQAAEAMQTSRKEMTKYLDEIDGNYEMIRVSRSLGVPHIWIMFYQKWNPADVQNYSRQWLVYDDGERVSIDQYDGYRLGKYIFGNIYYENRLDEEGTLFVGRPEDFPNDVVPLEIIENSAGKPSVYIVESVY